MVTERAVIHVFPAERSISSEECGDVKAEDEGEKFIAAIFLEDVVNEPCDAVGDDGRDGADYHCAKDVRGVMRHEVISRYAHENDPDGGRCDEFLALTAGNT